MKILYAAAGTTDPVRTYRDGGILHIVRHYRPDKVVIFLTDEMRKNEEYNGVYSRAVKCIAPKCEVELIKSEITDPHHIDSLMPILEEFVKIHKQYPDAEFLINLSSGTPQMKTIMDTIALDFERTTGVQVDSPAKKSNVMNHPEGKESLENLELLMENNEDNYEEFNHPNRCSEPQMDMLKRYEVRHEIITLVNNFEYSAALKVYNRYKALFGPKTGELLEHTAARTSLNFSEAFKYQSMDMYRKIKNSREIKELNEYRMLIEMHCRKKELTEFIVKLTPFLYQLVFFHMTKHLGIDMNSICDEKGNNFFKVREEKVKQNHPKFMTALNNVFGYFKDDTALSFYNLLIMMSTIDGQQELCNKLGELREIEENFRNKMAHTIVKDVTDEGLKKIRPFKDSNAINKLLLDSYKIVMEKESLPSYFIYQQLNEKIIDSLDNFN